LVNRHPYIAIEGPIGVGKTTLARILGESLPAEILLEVFEQNPFLSDFYTDRARYAFQTQLFFLLSRYHQQHRVIAETVTHSALVSDYLFAKDWLFAHLNLQGDEVAMYERVHAILGERIPAPDMIVYLRASTDTLMQRIAMRDRPYERQMDRDYMQALRQAYEQFFSDYTTAPLLVIDTEFLDVVRDPEARSVMIGQVKSALQTHSRQLRLLDVDIADPGELPVNTHLADWQRLQQAGEARSRPGQDIFFDYVSLAGRLGDLAQILARVWQEQNRQLAQAGNRLEAQERAVNAASAELEASLAATLDQLLRVANGAGIDLERAYSRYSQRMGNH
jgi:deoxyguanosine kinase